jgi:hypothetical protein
MTTLRAIIASLLRMPMRALQRRAAGRLDASVILQRRPRPAARDTAVGPPSLAGFGYGALGACPSVLDSSDAYQAATPAGLVNQGSDLSRLQRLSEETSDEDVERYLRAYDNEL